MHRLTTGSESSDIPVSRSRGHTNSQRCSKTDEDPREKLGLYTTVNLRNRLNKVEVRTSKLFGVEVLKSKRQVGM